MKYIILLSCLFSAVSCKTAVVKESPAGRNVEPVKSRAVSTRKHKKYKVKTSNHLLLKDSRLYYLWTPSEEERRYNLKLLYVKEKNYQKAKSLYYDPLTIALKKRIPENDAKSFIMKGQRFLLAHESPRGKAMVTGDILMPLGLGRGQLPQRYSFIAQKRCGGGMSHALTLEGVDNFLGEFYKIKTDYLVRWNRTMLKDCEKH